MIVRTAINKRPNGQHFELSASVVFSLAYAPGHAHRLPYGPGSHGHCQSCDLETSADGDSWWEPDHKERLNGKGLTGMFAVSGGGE
jgi:hypothetical protein